MKVTNVRHGFATNSSSSHSVIYNPELKNIKTSHSGDGFGWEFFTLADEKSKREYMAAQLYENLKDVLSDEMAHAILFDWCKINFDEALYVDHQSVWSLPANYNTTNGHHFINKHFFLELQDYILNHDVYVLGGNDNDSPHELYSAKHEVIKMLLREYPKLTIARKDGDWWTIFNPNTGNRVTFSFTADAKPILKFNTPMLVDMKITDFCTKACNYCYQDSTKNGKHADFKNISNIIWQLHKMAVFEVAIGGGEPTAHPNFANILDLFHQKEIIPNFTTKSLEWLKDKKILSAVNRNVGGFAYSVEKLADIDYLCESLEPPEIAEKLKDCLISIHIIPELLPDSELEQILIRARQKNFRATLLGFKPIGRGSTSKTMETNWFGIVKKLIRTWDCPLISIDTLLARKYKTDLIGYIDITLWFTDEGGRSMYIDAVSMKAAPSSYSNPEVFVDINTQIENIFNDLPIEN